MTRAEAIVVAFVAVALGGCVTLSTDGNVPSIDGAASPAATQPAPAPGNVFGPESPHYFGTGGP